MSERSSTRLWIAPAWTPQARRIVAELSDLIRALRARGLERVNRGAGYEPLPDGQRGSRWRIRRFSK